MGRSGGRSSSGAGFLGSAGGGGKTARVGSAWSPNQNSVGVARNNGPGEGKITVNYAQANPLFPQPTMQYSSIPLGYKVAGPKRFLGANRPAKQDESMQDEYLTVDNGLNDYPDQTD
jgi:hypothetical protein